MRSVLHIVLLFISIQVSCQINPELLINIYSINSTEMLAIAPAESGVLCYNTDVDVLFYWDGSNWVFINPSGNDRLIDGNIGTNPNNNFLGTIDDVRMQIRSNNQPILEFGRRQTLGLVQSFPDYKNANQSLVHLSGASGRSALQFQADAASFYKPMFYTTDNGSFRLKGSSGQTDFFEIGSASPSNDGRLELIIGDDEAEPIIFKRYDFRNGQFHKELFRVQGSNNTANAKTRFGININTNQVPIDSDYDDASAGFNVANSTLQVNASVSKSILETTGNLTLTEDHHAIVLGGNHTITLPAVNTCEGRVYVIKNPNNFATNISNCTNLEGVTNISTINGQTTIWLQSDGANWQQITESSAFPQILVDASRTNNYAMNQNYSTVVNNNKSTNFGSAYNTGNVVFIAPANGVYQITNNNQYSYTGFRNHTVYNRILINNNTVEMESTNGSWTNGNGNRAYSTNYGNTIVQLNAGQNVRIQHRENVNADNIRPETGQVEHKLKIIRLRQFFTNDS